MKRTQLKSAVIVAVLCLTLLPGLAAAEQRADMATFKAAGASAMWVAQPDAGAMALAIKGGKVQIRETFRA